MSCHQIPDSQYFMPIPKNSYLWRNLYRLFMQDVSKRVAQILIEKLGIAESEITPDANLVKDLGIDSLDYAEIVMDFEQTFDIKIPDDDAEKLSTIGNAVKYIESKLKDKK